MKQLARLSLANRAVVALITLAIALGGFWSLTNLRQELIPSISLPQTSIIAVSPGSSPELIDEQVAQPLAEALRGVPDVDSIVATSNPNMAIVTLTSTFGADTAETSAQIRNVLEQVQPTLPEGVEPELISGDFSQLPAMALTASSDLSIEELSSRLEAIAVPALSDVDGVRGVALSGGVQYRVEITPDAVGLAAAGLTTASILDALSANGSALPIGTIAENGQSIQITSGAPITTLDELRALPLIPAAASGGSATGDETGTPTASQAVALGEVAQVESLPVPATTVTRVNGQPAVSLSITAIPEANLVTISHEVQAQLDLLEQQIGGNVQFTPLFDQAPFIEQSIESLATEGALGLLFAVIVILIFLLSVRSTLVTAISIPLSVLVTFIGLYFSGYTLNVLTLGALTIAIGRVVDDSIVVIENIKRHLSYGEPKKRAIYTAVGEVAGAITASTLTTVAVFLPLIFVGDIVGELFRPFALTVTIAMVSSLFVALTIIPVLAYWFLGAPKLGVDAEAVRAEAEAREQKGVLQRIYAPVLRGTQRRPVITLIGAGLVLVLTGALIPLLRFDFLGATGQNTVSLSQSFEAGTDLESLQQQAEATETALRNIDGVDSVMMTGGAGDAETAAFSGASATDATYLVNTDPDADQARILDDIDAAIAGLPNPESVTVGAQSAGLGSSTVDVRVLANDEATLAQAAQQVFDALEGADETNAIETDLAAEQPVLQITARRDEAAAAGYTEEQLTGIVAASISEVSVAEVRIDNVQQDVLIVTGARPSTVEQVQQLPVPTLAGMVPLDSIADVTLVDTVAQVVREGTDRIATISLTPNEGQLEAATTDITNRLDAIDLPDGARTEIGGVAEDMAESFSQLGLAMLLAILIVFIVMVATFRSLVQPFILLISIPFAATGAIALLLVTNTALGVAALIGLLMLIGIVVTNAIVLIDLVNQYRRRGDSVQDAVFHGSRQRLRPIVMTALATIGALTPMALGITGSSGFISRDLSIVVIGGLISSTILTLVIVPVLYNLIEGSRERRRERLVAQGKRAQVAEEELTDALDLSAPVAAAVASIDLQPQVESVLHKLGVTAQPATTTQPGAVEVGASAKRKRGDSGGAHAAPRESIVARILRRKR